MTESLTNLRIKSAVHAAVISALISGGVFLVGEVLSRVILPKLG